MKVKAAKILWLAALDYVTEGKVYDVYNPTATGFGYIDSDGKKFSFYIFAISREHAACVVDDIRETAWLGDEIVG